MFFRNYRLAILLFTTALTFGAITLLSLPDVGILEKHYPLLTVNAKTKDLSVTFSKQRPGHWVGIGQLPKHVYGALIVSEDWSFYQHRGIDWGELKAAISESLSNWEKPRGASTLTQQLAKNVFLHRKRSYLRKLKEAVIALQLESQFNKKKILELYLNCVEFAPNLFGINKGTQYFFQKNVWDLTPEESAFMAMILPNPKELSVSFRQKKLTPYARARIQQILGKMKKAGYLDETFESHLAVDSLFIPAEQHALVFPDETTGPEPHAFEPID